MPQKKVLVIKNPVVEYRPASAGGVGAYTDISKWFKEFSIMPKKARVDTAGFGTSGKESEKGETEHQVKFSCFHSRSYSEFSLLLEAEFIHEDDTEFKVKYKNSAIDPDNPQFLFSVKVTDLGNLGGAKGAAAMLDATFDTEGAISKNNGTTTITL